MIAMEFTTTAMRRPSVLRETYGSFAQHLGGVDWRGSTLYLNVDPFPETASTDEVVAAAREFFGTVIVNTPTEPSFPRAVKWCWAQPSGEFFFHLEDDWRMVLAVAFDELLDRLEAEPDLSLVNLRVYPSIDGLLCLAPGLWRTAHARAIGARMREDANPEYQMRAATRNNPHGGLHVGYRGVQHPSPRVLIDIGRLWLARSGICRNNERVFTRWVSDKATVLN